MSDIGKRFVFNVKSKPSFLTEYDSKACLVYIPADKVICGPWFSEGSRLSGSTPLVYNHIEV